MLAIYIIAGIIAALCISEFATVGFVVAACFREDKRKRTADRKAEHSRLVSADNARFSITVTNSSPGPDIIGGLREQHEFSLVTLKHFWAEGKIGIDEFEDKVMWNLRELDRIEQASYPHA